MIINKEEGENTQRESVNHYTTINTKSKLNVQAC